MPKGCFVCDATYRCVVLCVVDMMVGAYMFSFPWWGGGGVLDRLTLVGVFSCLGFGVRGSFVRYNATSRQYLNIFGNDEDNGGARELVYT